MALTRRLQAALAATARLGEALRIEPADALIRDAAILRFEMAFEASWKAAQAFLRERHGLDLASPRAAWRTVRDVALMGDAETEAALAMTNDRNLIVHLYDEALAGQVFARLPGYHRLLADVLARIAAEVESANP